MNDQATSHDDYILGTDRTELERLGVQHEVWRGAALALWDRAGFGAGDTLADLGCGPGFTSLDLAAVVGPGGKILARDRSAGFLQHLTAEASRRELTWIEPDQGSVEELELPAASLDGAYARWLFCWLPDPGAVLRRVADALRPGAALAVQDYVHWGSHRVFPASPVHARVIDACLSSFRDGGGDIDIGGDLPRLAGQVGLRVEHLQPIARIGGVGSPVWRWVGGFYASYLPRLVERGLLTADEVAAHAAEWERRTAAGDSYCLAPTMLDVLLRKR